MIPAFASPFRCAPETTTSPLGRALESVDAAVVEDLSLQGVVELRGDVDAVSPGVGDELVRLTPRRAFLFTDGDAADAVERAREAGALAYDATGALAGMAIADERVLRRLTDLELEQIPTAGRFAKVHAIFRRRADGRYLVYVPQELGHYVAEAVLDALVGLGSDPWNLTPVDAPAVSAATGLEDAPAGSDPAGLTPEEDPA